MQAPANAPAKAPLMGPQHEPEDDFQCRTHQNLYFSGRENPALSGLCVAALITLPIII